jgi:hypothetical protein
MPFLVVSNEHSSQATLAQRVMPGNLPDLAQGRGEVEAMLEAARRQATVPDPWVTAGIVVGAPAAAVSLLVHGLQEAEFGFYDLRFADNCTTGDSLEVRTVAGQHRANELAPRGWDATVLGPEPGARLELNRSRGKRPAGDARLADAVVGPGAILIAYPPGRQPKVVFSAEGDAQQVTERVVHRVAQAIVLLAIAAGGVLFLIYLLQLVQRRGA